MLLHSQREVQHHPDCSTKLQGIDRKRLAKLSVECYLEQLLTYGFFHAGVYDELDVRLHAIKCHALEHTVYGRVDLPVPGYVMMRNMTMQIRTPATSPSTLWVVAVSSTMTLVRHFTMITAGVVRPSVDGHFDTPSECQSGLQTGCCLLAGMMGTIPTDVRSGLLELFYGVYEKDPDRCIGALVTMGVLIPGNDMTAVRRTAAFFLSNFEVGWCVTRS
jgi:hypothetical protein